MKALLPLLLVASCATVPCAQDLTRPMSECMNHGRAPQMKRCEVEVVERSDVTCITRDQLRIMMGM